MDDRSPTTNLLLIILILVMLASVAGRLLFGADLHNIAPSDTSICITTIQSIELVCLILIAILLISKTKKVFVVLFIVACIILAMLAKKPLSIFEQIREIRPSQYHTIYLYANDNALYTQAILPYVDDQCRMNSDNYRAYLNLVNNVQAPMLIKNFHITKSENEIKQLCANTVFQPAFIIK